MRRFFKTTIGLFIFLAVMALPILLVSRHFPPGVVIAYSSIRPDNDIHLLDVARQISRTLTDTPAQERGLRWSPDGERLAFINGMNNLYVMSFKGHQEQQLTHYQVYLRSLAWSADGHDIYFTASENRPIQMHVLTGDDANTRRVETPPVDYHDLMWSPDGQWLTFASLHEGDHEIYLMEWTTGKIQRLTERQTVDVSPSWSPDGSAIAFMSERGGQYTINVFDLDTGSIHQIKNITTPARIPRWSHDGKSLLYASGPSIYAVNRDGSNHHELVNVGSEIEAMALQPLAPAEAVAALPVPSHTATPFGPRLRARSA